MFYFIKLNFVLFEITEFHILFLIFFLLPSALNAALCITTAVIIYYFFVLAIEGKKKKATEVLDRRGRWGDWEET